MGAAPPAMMAELEALLVAAARTRRVMTYAEVARALAIPPPHTIHKAALLIEELMRCHAAAGAPQWASLVISRARGGLPAPGFFVLAGALGLYGGAPDGPDARAFHAAELERCFGAASA